MALEYVAAYYSYLDYLEELSDAECGRLFKACLIYGKTGTVPELRGNERFVWPGMRSQIDRDAEKYKARCEQNRSNRQRPSTNENERKRTPTKPTNENENAKENENANANNNGVNPIAPFPSASQDLVDAFNSWLAYKQERREGYKKTGLQSLMTQIHKGAVEYGDQAVADLIRECMAANWRGIIFDRLKNKNQRRQNLQPACDRTAPDKRAVEDMDRMRRILEKMHQDEVVN